MSRRFSAPHCLRVAGVYAFVGSLWIAFSDQFVAALTDDVDVLTRIQMVKGWTFVALSALLIAAMVHRAIRREAVAAKALRRSEERFRDFFDKAAVGLAEVDLTGRWTMVNHRLCAMLGYEAAEMLQHTARDMTHPDFHEAEDQSMRHMLAGVTSACARERRLLCKDGMPLWVLLSANLVREAQTGKAQYFIAVIQSIEDRKRAEADLQAALAEKEVLLAEIHHRVRNNLQLVVTLLSLEAAKFPDKKVRAAFDSTLARIEAMGLIHQQLYQNQNFSEIAFDHYVRDLCEALIAAVAPSTVGFRYELAPVHCTLAYAVPMGLILVELLVNALKHAFPDERRGTIVIRLGVENDRIHLEVADDGVGLPAELGPDCSGLTIVRMLTTQLGGQLAACVNVGGGTKVRLDFALE